MKKFLAGAVIAVVSLFVLRAPTVSAQDFCEGDFNYNGSVAAEDVTVFLNHFGRSKYNNPCPPDGPAPVPKTGQTTCYDTDGNPILCRMCFNPPTGCIPINAQDGSWRKGVALPEPRFTDNGNGTITDNLTGLIWLKNANCFGERTWQEALDDCEDLSAGYCGLTDGSSTDDWRLPNRFELESLLVMNYAAPALSNTAGTGKWTAGNPFNNVLIADSYWTSTTLTNNSDYAWFVNTFIGHVDAISKGMDFFYVWPVRGGH